MSGGAATLNAAVGAAVLYSNTALTAIGTSTAAGCATAASPTGGTWAIDYSQQDAARLSYTDLVIGATTTQLTSAANPFTVAMPGNAIGNVAGTGFTAGWYNVRSVAGGVATLDRAVGTAASTAGSGSLGGALATPGKAAGLMVAGNGVWIKAGTYTCSATANVAGGNVSLAVGGSSNAGRHAGYDAIRGDSTGNRPILNAGAATMTLWTSGGADLVIENIQVGNPSAFAAVAGFRLNGFRTQVSNCVASAITGAGFYFNNAWQEAFDCLVTGGGAGSNAIRGYDVEDSRVHLLHCVVRNFSGPGFYAATAGILFQGCVAAGGTGTQGVGFDSFNSSQLSRWVGCTAYGNASHGFNLSSSQVIAESCVAEANGGFGFNNGSSATFLARLINCAGFNNTSGNYVAANVALGMVRNFVAYTASAFTSPATGDFSLNTAANGGARLRAAGWPSSFNGLLGTSYPDIGAYQSQASSGVSGGFLPIGMTGGV